MQVPGGTFFQRPAADPRLHGTGVDAVAALAHEQSRLLCSRQPAAHFEPVAHRRPRLAAHGHPPGLGALAGDLQRAVRHVDVAEVDRDQLGQPQAG